jgi:hypothetical protein
MFPLLMANKLGDFIVGTALETIDTEKLIEEFEREIVKEVYENDTPVRQVVSNFQEYIQSNGTRMNRVVMDQFGFRRECTSTSACSHAAGTAN